jgi:Bardet-Biedl syndrome 1 protein
MSSSDPNSPWLNAWYDPLAGVRTSTQNLRMADLHADGDSKLVLCDGSKKLKVYRGTGLAVESDLLDFPVALCVTYAELASVCISIYLSIYLYI